VRRGFARSSGGLGSRLRRGRVIGGWGDGVRAFESREGWGSSYFDPDPLPLGLGLMGMTICSLRGRVGAQPNKTLRANEDD
jgi:hypothetical protein